MKRIALIGFGNWGCNLARTLFELKSLCCICDVDLKKLKTARENYPLIRTFQSIEALPIENIDAVVIATPAKTHYALARKMLNLGKDVFVEKPLAFSVDEGEELVRLAEEGQKILMVGHILQYHPAILKLKKMIDNNELGRIYYIYSNRLNIGRFRSEENILWSFAPHDISAMLFLLVDMPENVSCCGGAFLRKDIADITMSNFSFRKGIKAHIYVSWLHPFKEQKLVIIGEKMMVVFDDVISERKLISYKHKIKIADINQAILFKDRANIISLESTEPLKNECEAFIHSLENRTQPVTDGRSGLEVLRVLSACQLSLAKKGQMVKI